MPVRAQLVKSASPAATATVLRSQVSVPVPGWVLIARVTEPLEVAVSMLPPISSRATTGSGLKVAPSTAPVGWLSTTRLVAVLINSVNVTLVTLSKSAASVALIE